MIKKIIISSILILALIISSQFMLAFETLEIENQSINDYILKLVNNHSVSNSSVNPKQVISRGEFAIALAQELELDADNKIYFIDLQNYTQNGLINALINEEIISGYPDETFRPNEPITKADAVSALIKALGIKSNQEMIDLSENESFTDTLEHEAAKEIEIAKSLNLISEKQGKFFPDNYLSKNEADNYLKQLQKLNSNHGYLTDVYPTSKKASFNLNNGQREIYNLTDEIIIARNNRQVVIDEILSTDKVFVITDNQSNIKYLKAYGLITEEDLAAEVSSLTRGLIAPQEIKEIVSGNYNILTPKIFSGIENELIKQGLNQEEIEAIMNTDWNQLEYLSKTRLMELIAMQTSLPLDITRSIFNTDWEKLKSYAQMELVQRVMQEVINSGILS